METSSAMPCTVCRYPIRGRLPGPSDHEAWCPAFMVGAIDLEGQTSILEVLEPAPMLDPAWTPAAGYSHAERLARL